MVFVSSRKGKAPAKNITGAFEVERQTLSLLAALGADDDLAFHHVCDEARALLPHRRDGQLHLLVDVSLEEARAVGRAVALLGQEVERGLGHVASLALLLHLAAELAGVYLRDVAHLVHRSEEHTSELQSRQYLV